MAAIRFNRAGTSFLAANNQTTSRWALAPVPAGADDPNGYSNLNANGDSDPINIGKFLNAAITLYSDTTCSAGLQVFVGPTSTGPWVGLGSVSVNPALATPIQVNPFSGGNNAWVKVVTSSYVSGNPRAVLTAISPEGRNVP